MVRIRLLYAIKLCRVGSKIVVLGTRIMHIGESIIRYTYEVMEQEKELDNG